MNTMSRLTNPDLIHSTDGYEHPDIDPPSITEIHTDFPGEFPTIDEMNVSSTTELTGMMYRPPINESELESYQNLYDIEYNAFNPDANR